MTHPSETARRPSGREDPARVSSNVHRAPMEWARAAISSFILGRGVPLRRR
jgi:hypothetical protein